MSLFDSILESVLFLWYTNYCNGKYLIDTDLQFQSFKKWWKYHVLCNHYITKSKATYGGLNRNGPQRLMYVNAVPLGVALLGDVSLLK